MSRSPFASLLARAGRLAGLPGLAGAEFGLQSAETCVWGLADVQRGRPLLPEASFPIASLTKPFTAELVLQLAEAQGIGLDTPLREHWPAFRHADPAATRDLSLRDALCHRSGLPPHLWAWVFSRESRQQFFSERFAHLASLGPFRHEHRYSNLLYAALGEWLATLAGDSWETLLRDRILHPLGLMQTASLTEDWTRELPALALPHAAGNPPRPLPPFVATRQHLIAPASELASSLTDLCRWGQWLLRSPPDVPRWQAACPIRPGLDYGLGWRLQADFQGSKGRRVWHSGQCTGYSVLLTLYPEAGHGRVLLCNADGVVDVLHAVDAARENGQSLQLPQITAAAKPPAPAWPDCPAGTLPEGDFANKGYGALSLFAREGSLWSRFQTSDAVKVLLTPDGTPCLQMPVYGRRFPLRAAQHTIALPLEPLLPEIQFSSVL